MSSYTSPPSSPASSKSLAGHSSSQKLTISSPLSSSPACSSDSSSPCPTHSSRGTIHSATSDHSFSSSTSLSSSEFPPHVSGYDANESRHWDRCASGLLALGLIQRLGAMELETRKVLGYDNPNPLISSEVEEQDHGEKLTYQSYRINGGRK